MGYILERMKHVILHTPIIGTFIGRTYVRLLANRFDGSEKYWSKRYAKGGNSGGGSYNKSAEFKAEVLNKFLKDHDIESCIEYGCGDGNQLKLVNYRKYLGFDVSLEAITICQGMFRYDETKNFKLMKDYAGERAELTVSLDVIYHLVEDGIFEAYMERLFSSSDRFVVVFSTDTDEQNRIQAPHVRNRKFTAWIGRNIKGWILMKHVANKYSSTSNPEEGPFADFYIYEKVL